MAHKITLGTRPKSFKRTVQVPLHEGAPGELEVHFKYRTRSEFGAFVDQIIAAAKVAPPARPVDGDELALSMHAAMEAARDQNADYLLQVLDGWNLDTPLSLDTLRQLCDELPGAAIALMDAYRAACVEGRLGN